MVLQLVRALRSACRLSERQPIIRVEKRDSFRPCLEGLEERMVPSLTPIAANAGYPYTSIVEIQATFPDGKTFVGSGAMVDSFHVLSAGHMVYDAGHGGWATKVTAIPELNGTSQPFGSAQMTYERTYNGWVTYSKAHPGSTAPGDYDISLITLNKTIGNSTGWMSFGYNNNNATFASGNIFNTAGYPAAGGYNGTKMQFSSGAIAGLSSDGSAIQYYQSNITTYGGQSGSPLWSYNASTGTRVIYGVHVGGSGTSTSLNFATRITQSIYTDLVNWMKADKVPSTTSLTAASTQSSGSSLLLTASSRLGNLQSADLSGFARIMVQPFLSAKPVLPSQPTALPSVTATHAQDGLGAPVQQSQKPVQIPAASPVTLVAAARTANSSFAGFDPFASTSWSGTF